MIYARAITEVFQNGEDPRNGSAVLQKIRNRSYHSVQGFDVRIAHSEFNMCFTQPAPFITSSE
jgi:hypothetical protein